MGGRIEITVLLVSAVLLAGCRREERPFREAVALARTPPVSQSALHPGGGSPPALTENPFEGNAWAIAEGRRLYVWFNCAGCHFNGGGGIGPALMDGQWIYGSSAANIFATIVEGRPNGMPSFRDRIADQQVWQITAYVRALAELPGAGKPPARKQAEAAETGKDSGQSGPDQ